MSIFEKLKTILVTNDFEQLSRYSTSTAWTLLNATERELLGILFIKQGEQQLKAGEAEFEDSFALAKQVAGESPTIYFSQASAYAVQGQNIRCLSLALECLETAVRLDPKFITAWHSMGNVLVKMGIFYNDPSYFYSADKNFYQANLLAAKSGQSELLSELIWHWGVCWCEIGKHSGEIVDYLQSLEKFRLAFISGASSPAFHNDFGNVLVSLSFLIDRSDLLIEASEHYKTFVNLEPLNSEGWFNLAYAYQCLNNLNEDNSYFFEADECYEKALELKPENAHGWFLWAELYLSIGKAWKDVDYTQESLKKFEQASTLDPDNPHIQLKWAEAQILKASNVENLELLRHAESKIVFCLKALSELPQVWYIYGICLCELGRYFTHEEYYDKAIDKFKHGLAINPTHPLLLCGIAQAHFTLGELTLDPSKVKESLSYYQLLQDSQEALLPQILNDWGVALMKFGELTNEKFYIESAAEKFEQAINKRYDQVEAGDLELEWLYNYGCAMDFLGDFYEHSIHYEKAVQILSYVVQLDSDYIFAKYNLALSLFHLGELNSDLNCFHKSINLFQELLKEDPEDELVWNDLGLTILNLAVLTEDSIEPTSPQNLFQLAEYKFQQALALGNIEAFYNLACCHSLNKNASAALHYLERAQQNDALPSLDDLIHDEWLEALHDEPFFRLFISRLMSNDEQDEPT